MIGLTLCDCGGIATRPTRSVGISCIPEIPQTIGRMVNNWFTRCLRGAAMIATRSSGVGFLLCQQRVIDVVGDPDAACLGE
jgi:hypothetical protein